MRILCFDPSGNFSKNEGSGTSGWAYFEDGELKTFGDVKAESRDSAEEYWQAIWNTTQVLITDEWGAGYNDVRFVCESYKLQPGKAMVQSYSALETPQLIGYLRMQAWTRRIKFIFQDPSCKIRVADPILEHMGIIEKKNNRWYCQGRMTNDHQRDAIRHGVFFNKYGTKS